MLNMTPQELKKNVLEIYNGHHDFEFPMWQEVEINSLTGDTIQVGTPILEGIGRFLSRVYNFDKMEKYLRGSEELCGV